jgi:hypothetical protein
MPDGLKKGIKKMESITSAMPPKKFDRPLYPNISGEDLIESSGFTPTSDVSAYTAPVITSIASLYIVDVGMIMRAVEDLPDIDAGVSTIIDAEIVDE